MISENPTVGNLLVETLKSRDVSHWDGETYIPVLSMELEHLTSFRFSMERICADQALAACLILLDLFRSKQLQQTCLAGNP